jgi:hypothetical protein
LVEGIRRKEEEGNGGRGKARGQRSRGAMTNSSRARIDMNYNMYTTNKL